MRLWSVSDGLLLSGLAGCNGLLRMDPLSPDESDATTPDASLLDAPAWTETGIGDEASAEASTLDSDAEASIFGCDDGGVTHERRCSGYSAVLTCSIDGTWASRPCADYQICVGGTRVVPLSCIAGGATSRCGPDGGLPVQGASFVQEYERTSFADSRAPATISSFRFDNYEVTVGRYRQFVDAVLGTIPRWTPDAGSGKHVHLNDGNGLLAIAAGAPHEFSWNPTWENGASHVFLNGPNWRQSFTQTWCRAQEQTYTAAPGGHEQLPINCYNWYEAYALCIWDGGFLPSGLGVELCFGRGRAATAVPLFFPARFGDDRSRERQLLSGWHDAPGWRRLSVFAGADRIVSGGQRAMAARGPCRERRRARAR